ncbi:hypothetical protein LTR64_006646 [Lithohypha guttulata]|uniref:uncharacterized protein n=1 Tax=Lithohypha guttulata TaxID=1690604 RepID=UPI002DDFF7D4|nr:hypothetical protein LTR51_004795 [Lithohypha guttulata]
MSQKIFITGSADGLGSLAAQALVKKGHRVTLHARNAQRAQDAEKACPGADEALVADLSSLEETKQLADELNNKGPWDAIIHNAGVMRSGPIFATNTLAPYVLACLVQPPPKRLVFLSSMLHQGGDPSLRDIQNCGYGDSKLHNTMMAFAFAKRYGPKGVTVTSLDPGWVPTKMGGAGATGDIQASVKSYVSLAEGTAQGACGQHWYHQGKKSFHQGAADVQAQEKLLKELESISGVSIPA